MLRRAFIVLGLLASATSAPATVMTSFSAGTFGLQAGETLIADFDTTFGGADINNAGYFTGLTPNIAAPPAGDITRYLAVLTNGYANFTFTPVSAISFDLGSLDNFNSIYVDVVGASNPVLFSGTVMNGGTANGDQFSSSTNGRLTIYGSASELFTGIRLVSAGNSFEIDNLAARGTAAVPEMTTWAMFLIGFGLLGHAARRKRKEEGVEADPA